MRIGFDAIRAFRNATGLGNYARFVIEALLEHETGNDYVLYTPTADRPASLAFLEGRPEVEVRVPPKNRRGRLLKDAWRTFAQGRQAVRDGVDVYHGLTHEIPRDLRRANVPGVVTMHDVLWRTMPETYAWADRRIYDWKYGYSVLHADAVIAVSGATARAVKEHWPIPDDRLHVVHQGCHAAFRRPLGKTAVEEARRRHDLPSRYLLQVGTIEARKNAVASVRALAALPAARRVPLVLVGRPTAYADEVRAAARRWGVEAELRFLRDLPFEQLVALMHGAALVLYPSKGEGFGIPVLEAMTCGRPVITGNAEVFREVGEDAPVYVDPGDIEGLAAAIDRILADPEWAAELGQRGRARAEAFAPARIAADLMAVYRQVAGR